MISGVIWTGASMPLALEVTRARSPSASPSRAASSGWMSSVQGSSPFISAGTLCIHELFERNSRRPIRAIAGAGRDMPWRRRSRSATIGSGASSILPDGVRKTSGMRGCSGPRSSPLGCPR